MNNIHPDGLDLAVQQDVITLSEYETCPTIKSNNKVNTVIAVKSDETYTRSKPEEITATIIITNLLRIVG